jgi:ubiquinone/menaquinone biosynthesis C-methylase UbiE
MKEFWEEQALKHGENVAAVNFDPIAEQIETKLLEELIADGLSVADIGCGNGGTLIELALARPNGIFVGYDFAQGMVDVAETHRNRIGLKNVRFVQFDATSPSIPDMEAYDIVLGKRLLINIRGPAKLQALKNIYAMLKPNGVYMMIECFLEPLERINDIRSRLGLDRINVRSFNEYLKASFMEEIGRYFVVEKLIDRGSLYYFISRVFNAYLSGGKPEYQAPINKLAAQLTLDGVEPMQGYAPEVTYLLKKKTLP